MKIDDILANLQADDAGYSQYQAKKHSQLYNRLVEMTGCQVISSALIEHIDSDTDYTRMSRYAKLPVLRVLWGTNYDKLYKTLLNLNTRLWRIQSPKYSCVRYVKSSNDFKGKGESPEYLWLYVIVNNVELILALDSTNKKGSNFVKALQYLDASKREFKAYKAEQAIHNSRKRVLGDKYNPEMMYTRLV
ncbi:hypothetical protein NCTGTJJY_CDS0136 [Serratia phage 92A1]|nr:hypothetical protein NCTGTJJY_CDS0136 [Serratia phage 92A1]